METTAIDKIQADTLAALRTLFEPGQSVALLDFPDHFNAGDHLIWLGQLKYLKQLGLQINYTADPLRYDAELLRDLVPDGPILLTGGGNLGDRWTVDQDFRERVIQDFPDRQIIQLPQSVDFSEESPRLATAKSVFGAHPNLTILIRDTVSLRKARDWFPTCRVMFCPDLAFGVGVLEPAGEAAVDVLYLKRADSESIPENGYLPESGVTVTERDWEIGSAPHWHYLHIPAAFAMQFPKLGRRLQPTVTKFYEKISAAAVNRAIANLSAGKVVVTDRLHATILAALIGREVAAFDNANGKVRAIYEDYLKTVPGVTFLEFPAEARAFVKSSIC
ncbi:polysaccharide pyruvyl transferase family protein [Rhodococcus sp. (in: high G+C Gram-positive bacteria)]|uniref:polysaccharide pyruvyl transferase family protein n=1 Tax=Rhodococcus sp. TaxID=1831 RepID=UPI001A1A2B58|nr:polysaccharide pyruvyl transferase family protein [Rhodococcus sp. (in: high G+C Gram-positive bacteria)]MBJ7480335.1 polysaccharide pyruvyl transferase family protein [Rhodococcus sp. (in: high G+C Gram-positive bacteria)]